MMIKILCAKTNQTKLTRRSYLDYGFDAENYVRLAGKFFDTIQRQVDVDRD